MRHVGHPARRVAIELLELVLMRAHHHQVRTDVELVVRGSAFHRFHPSANIHISDANAIDARRGPGTAVLNPAHEDTVEAPRLIVWKAGSPGRQVHWVEPL